VNKRKQTLMAMDKKRLADVRVMRSKRQLAFDKKSQRSVDADGRLHIALTNISKANVCPYQGSEIPDADALGLDPDKVYNLFRDPEELAKAAPSFNNLPLLSMHVPVSAAEPMKELIVGSTGTDAQMVGPYLVNSMVIWDDVAIAGIQSEVQRELSCAYRYVADMTPGSVNGERYDGRMTQIIGNHIALVETGRAGPDVYAADSQLNTELSLMKLSRKALTVRGALHAYLLPKLAQDSKIELLNPLVKDITSATFAKDAAVLIKAVESKFKPKLAKDADLEDLKELIDAFTAKEDGESALDEDDDAAMDDEGEVDPEDTNATALKFLKGKLSPDDHAAVSAIFATKDGKAKDAIPDDPDDDDKAKKAKPVINRAQDDNETDPIKAPNTKAMDAAIKVAQDATVKRMNDIRIAEKAVAPYIGEVALQSSAAAVYKLALDHAKVDLTDVPPTAYSALLKLVPLPGSRDPSARVAMDSAAVSSFTKAFPTAVMPKRM
jgi:hypothetical protein